MRHIKPRGEGADTDKMAYFSVTVSLNYFFPLTLFPWIAGHKRTRFRGQACHDFATMAHRGGEIHYAAGAVARLVYNVRDNGGGFSPMADKCPLNALWIKRPIRQHFNPAGVITARMNCADNHRCNKFLIQHFARRHAINHF